VVEVRPFRGLRYNLKKVGDIRKVLTLPYDIITEKRRGEYQRLSEYNFVRLILGEEKQGDNGDNKYVRAKRLLGEWIRDGILVEDKEPGLYVYEEEYTGNGGGRRQAGIVGLVRLEPFEKGVILPHERIYERPLEDRYRLLKETGTCLEMIIGLAPDERKTTLGVVGRCRRRKPELDFIHDDDVRHRLWKVTDRGDIEAVTEALKGEKVIIADGHHRYTTALRYSGESSRPGAAYIMMLLLSMEDDLRVLPIHRLLRNIAGDIKGRLTGFEVEEVKSGLDGLLRRMDSLRGGHAFGMYDGKYYLLKLEDKKLIKGAADGSMSREWNTLDVNLLQNLVIKRALGVDVEGAIEAGDMAFIKDASKAVGKVDSGEYEVAFLLNPVRMEQIRAVAEAGERMPQKSTYFYPKPLSGLLAYRL